MDNPIIIFLTQFVKVMDTLAGRDRITKILQYGAKVVNHTVELRRQSVMYHLEQSNGASLAMEQTFYKQVSKRISNFESSISDARKVYRFFKSIGSLLEVYKFVVNIYNHYWKRREMKEGDKQVAQFRLRWIDIVKISQKFLLSIYILYDHASWAAKAGLFSEVSELNAVHIWQKLFNNSRARHYSDTSCKMWFIGTLLTLISDLYEYYETFNEEVRCLREKCECISEVPEGFLNLNDFLLGNQPQSFETSASVNSKSSRISKIDANLKKIGDKKAQVVRNILKNTSDLLVSGNGGFKVWSLNNAIVGSAGCASAFIGLYETWPSL